MTYESNWKTRRVELKDTPQVDHFSQVTNMVEPYKNTKVTNFGGKPLSEYSKEIKKDDRYINKMKHYSNKK